MSNLRFLVLATLLSISGLTFGADEVDAQAIQGGEPDTASCIKSHSKALCIARAGRIAGPMKDGAPGEVKALIEDTRGDALWYAGAAAGSATNVFRQAKGVSQGAEVGILLLGMLTSIASSTELIGRNLIVAWMPARMASTKEEANEEAQQLLLDATFASFPGSTVSAESSSAVQSTDSYSLTKPDQLRYRISGGACEGHECLLVPQMKTYAGGGLMGTRAITKKAPDFIGGGDSYQYGTRIGALYALALSVDGKLQTHTYLQELSKHLPTWMYVVASPETKLTNGQLLNEGQKVPVMYNEGRPMHFAYPAIESAGQKQVSAN